LGRRFLQEVEEEGREIQEAVAAAMDGLVADVRERFFARCIEQAWLAACWIEKTGQFPNGRPLVRQFPADVSLMQVFLRAIGDRAAREMEEAGKGAAVPPDFAFYKGAIPDGAFGQTNDGTG